MWQSLDYCRDAYTEQTVSGSRFFVRPIDDKDFREKTCIVFSHIGSSLITMCVKYFFISKLDT